MNREDQDELQSNLNMCRLLLFGCHSETNSIKEAVDLLVRLIRAGMVVAQT